MGLYSLSVNSLVPSFVSLHAGSSSTVRSPSSRPLPRCLYLYITVGSLSSKKQPPKTLTKREFIGQSTTVGDCASPYDCPDFRPEMPWIRGGTYRALRGSSSCGRTLEQTNRRCKRRSWTLHLCLCGCFRPRNKLFTWHSFHSETKSQVYTRAHRRKKTKISPPRKLPLDAVASAQARRLDLSPG